MSDTGDIRENNEGGRRNRVRSRLIQLELKSDVPDLQFALVAHRHYVEKYGYNAEIVWLKMIGLGARAFAAEEEARHRLFGNNRDLPYDLTKNASNIPPDVIMNDGPVIGSGVPEPPTAAKLPVSPKPRSATGRQKKFVNPEFASNGQDAETLVTPTETYDPPKFGGMF
ncbi:MAG TPA: hypothetical protein PK231_09270 [Acidocella sp.]|nr:hypothetical protein [Acidocella sp.]